MSATSRLKQLLFIIAGLALIVVGLTSLTTAAQADDTGGGEPCVETQDSFTDWVNEGDVIQTVANTPPGPDTDTVRYIAAGTVPVGNGDGVEATPDTALQRYSWNPQGPVDESITSPTWPTPQQGKWQANTSNYNGTDPLGVPFQQASGNGGDNASWFYWDFTPGTDGQEETFHTEYLWQKQVRTFVEGTDCPPEEECPDGDHNGDAEGCEDDDDEKCPEGTDNAGQNIDEVESCDDDDPIIDPGEGEEPGKNPGNNPGNSPSNNPGNSPSANPQGSNLPNNAVTPVTAPGADVPSAVNAGLAPTQQELIGSGNGLGLIGMGTVLIGLGLLGLTLSPRRGRKLAG